ncbi:hypothetical protein [Pandoravirus japonicus]|uniref:Uncharacterized protein n=1 Tax=Pandoravirus japonicus TaxID=2823154 RepID=A0A811BPF3_9VIRU|nr:hypothetical protein [Pandoravirus japonicus]
MSSSVFRPLWSFTTEADPWRSHPAHGTALARPRPWTASHSSCASPTTTEAIGHDAANAETLAAPIAECVEWEARGHESGRLDWMARYAAAGRDRWRGPASPPSPSGAVLCDGLFSTEHGLRRRHRLAGLDAYDGAISTAPISQPDGVRHALAMAACLMEAYVRFLFAHASSAESRGLEPAVVSRALNTVHPAVDLVGRVAGSPRLGPLQNRAAAWYRWITTSSRQGRPSLIGRLFAESPGFHGDGHASADDVAMLVGCLARRGVEMGAQGLALPIPSTVQPLFYIKGAEDRRRLADDALRGLVDTDQLAAWAHGGDATTSTILASRRAREAVLDFVNRQVRRRARGLCAIGPLPHFTDLFAVRLYMVPVLGDIVLMGAIESPIVEALLGAALSGSC